MNSASKERIEEEPDAALVARARRGDTTAFEILAQRHVKMVIGLLRQRACSDADAEDLAQEQIVGVVDGDATDAGCGQQQGTRPADPAGRGGLPASYVIPPGADPVETKAVTFALYKVGGPYVWGGNGPSGYDCSGLVTAAWAYAGVTIPRTSQAELGAGTPVASAADISPGDLVLVPGSGDGGTLASPGHVAMYIGDGLVVAAADTQVGIIVQTYSSLISGGLSGIRHIA